MGAAKNPIHRSAVSTADLTTIAALSKAQIRVQTTTKWSRPNTYVSETLSSQRTGTIVSSRTLLSFMDENIIASGLYICLVSNTNSQSMFVAIDFCYVFFGL